VERLSESVELSRTFSANPLLWEQRVVGSNPASPTIYFRNMQRKDKEAEAPKFSQEHLLWEQKVVGLGAPVQIPPRRPF